MKRFFLLAGLATFLFGGSASAEWIVDQGVDPLTDVPWASINIDEPHGLMLLLKCWRGLPHHAAFGITKLSKYPSQSPFSLKDLPIRYRQDQGSVRTIPLTPDDIGGRPSIVGRQGSGIPVAEILSDLTMAKDRVTIGIGQQIFTFTTQGAPSSAETMKAVCGI